MKNMLEAIRGISPKIIIGAVVGIVLAAGAVWLVVRRTEAPAGHEGDETVRTPGATEQLDGLAIGSPNLDFSVSPMGDLGLAGFELGADMPAMAFGNISVNDDFSYGGSVSLTVPTVGLTAPTEFDIDAPAPPPVPPPAPPPGGGGSGTAPTPSASTCAQFSGVPSCSYVPDPNGRALCEACKSAGY